LTYRRIPGDGKIIHLEGSIMQQVSSPRSSLIAFVVAMLALVASLATASAARAADKPADSTSMTVKVEGKKMKIAGPRDLERVTRKLRSEGQLRKNWGRARFNIWTHLRGIVVDCAWSAVQAAVGTTWHYVWHYRRLPSGGELWNGTRGGCWITRYI
jgi:hypothetical protein